MSFTQGTLISCGKFSRYQWLSSSLSPQTYGYFKKMSGTYEFFIKAHLRCSSMKVQAQISTGLSKDHVTPRLESATQPPSSGERRSEHFKAVAYECQIKQIKNSSSSCRFCSKCKAGNAMKVTSMEKPRQNSMVDLLSTDRPADTYLDGRSKHRFPIGLDPSLSDSSLRERKYKNLLSSHCLPTRQFSSADVKANTHRKLQHKTQKSLIPGAKLHLDKTLSRTFCSSISKAQSGTVMTDGSESDKGSLLAEISQEFGNPDWGKLIRGWMLWNADEDQKEKVDFVVVPFIKRFLCDEKLLMENLIVLLFSTLVNNAKGPSRDLEPNFR
ncbi:hypothetical protein PoB_007366400 [Plakobranchus ocellatus]|uniref:Uncharacterized protein n=1 Tax=Plakobranchus ocellatus TaxID=259542 RepID=A0AAV4DT26_9GAST|nr:hypothetical protein PoB_007366400 [Plakobranchus ocellatus]